MASEQGQRMNWQPPVDNVLLSTDGRYRIRKDVRTTEKQPTTLYHLDYQYAPSQWAPISWYGSSKAAKIAADEHVVLKQKERERQLLKGVCS